MPSCPDRVGFETSHGGWEGPLIGNGGGLGCQAEIAPFNLSIGDRSADSHGYVVGPHRDRVADAGVGRQPRMASQSQALSAIRWSGRVPWSMRPLGLPL